MTDIWVYTDGQPQRFRVFEYNSKEIHLENG